MNINWSPSLMLVDLLKLQEEMNVLADLGCPSFHIDVMDGNYVPNFTLGLLDVVTMNKITKIPLEVHLMVNDPIRILHLYDLENVSTIMVHPEACLQFHSTLSKIKAMNKRVGVVLNPGTPVSYLDEVMDIIDCVLVMAVNPGFARQNFIPSTYDKLKRVKETLQLRPDIEILVDGAVGPNNAKKLIDAGARGFVLGTASIFKNNNDFKRNFKELLNSVSNH